jgi:hypothetical protein
MKKLTSITIAFFLVLSAIPAMAADQADSNREPVTFQAFSNLPPTERNTLTPLTETELAAIEGSDVCGGALSTCTITLSATVSQSNTCTTCSVSSTAANTGDNGSASARSVLVQRNSSNINISF